MALRSTALRSALALTLLIACSKDRSSSNGGDPFANGRDGGGKNGGDDSAGSDGFDNGDSGSSASNGGSNSGSDPADAGSSNGNPSGTTLPDFPGSGTSNAGDPLQNGMLCDAVAGADGPIPDKVEQCFFDKDDPSNMVPAATLEQVLECVEETDTVHIRLTFHPWFVDNTYGDNSVGWHVGKPGKAAMAKGGHSFDDLLESDHAEITMKDATGKAVLQFKLDYISDDPSKPSGYGSLGVLGGEGEMIIGDASDIVRWMTSEDLNLNDRGYASYTSESPATDADYTPNPATPEWDYRVVYEAWIDIDVFGDGGFGGASIEFVHASPSKASSNTVEVVPGDCPCSDPDRCHKDPPPECDSNDPDKPCGDAGIGDAGTPNDGDPVTPPVM